jgi:hypothetical protein
MKTHELSETLAAFASLAGGSRAEDLHAFAGLFREGKAQTVAARLKQTAPGCGLPLSLKEGLTAIGAGLLACGAKKQAADIEAVLSKFDGQVGGSVGDLIARLKSDALARPARAARPKKAPAAADQALARQLADDLTTAVLDRNAFSGILQRLNDTKQVSTPTLHAIGNRFLGNSKVYSGRKPVITDIQKRHSEELLDASRRAAVKRAG